MTPTAPRILASASVALLVALAAPGCGYSQADYGFGAGGPAAAAAAPTEGTAGTTAAAGRSLYRADVRTIAVPIFANRTYARNVEFNLSKAVVAYIESNTPYKVVPKERADTILEGEVTRVEIDTVSNSSTAGGIPQEQLMEIRVNFTWKDLRDGRILTQRRWFDQSGTYYPTLGEGRFVGEQQNVERLAIAIVQELQSDW